MTVAKQLFLIKTMTVTSSDLNLRLRGCTPLKIGSMSSDSPGSRISIQHFVKYLLIVLLDPELCHRLGTHEPFHGLLESHQNSLSENEKDKFCSQAHLLNIEDKNHNVACAGHTHVSNEAHNCSPRTNPFLHSGNGSLSCIGNFVCQQPFDGKVGEEAHD